MSARGVLFALDDAQQDVLSAAVSDEEVVNVVAQIAEQWDREWLFETDKAWDAIHRSLTDGKLEYANGEYPLNHCILGGYQLHEGSGWVVSVVPAEQVKDVAEALKSIDKNRLRKGYDAIQPDYDGEVSAEDFEYTWANFEGLPEFYAKVAKDDRAVVFTVDF